uniref:C1q domain-containing protein n=1 Tax=Gadus morhua TaxID=8049 RepID=A0A8C5ARV5_GADMO
STPDLLQRLTQELAQQLQALKESTSAAQPRVAFSTGLGLPLGPLHIDTTVRYLRIFSNMGNGYNPATGIFTARVSGMYYFRYTMHNNNVGSSPNSLMSLMKNGQWIVSTWDTTGDDFHDSATNAAVLQLEVGDNVYTKLYAYRELYDDVMFYNTFSGFLAKIRTPPGTPITLAAVPRMAFTAALGHSLGPVHIDLTVKYPLIISNIGNGYNPATGIFTARVSGMYYFRYTMFNNLGSRSNSVMSLMKNSQRMVSTWDTSGSDDNDTATNAAVLQLEEGDNVYTRLYANRQIYDDGANYNTFSGFLLFPLPPALGSLTTLFSPTW